MMQKRLGSRASFWGGMVLALVLIGNCSAEEAAAGAAGQQAMQAAEAVSDKSPAKTPGGDTGKSTDLIGASYTRAFIAPRFVGKKWAVNQQVALDVPSPHDLLLVSNNGQKALVLSRQRRRLQGVTYEYVVADELLTDAVQATQFIAACKGDDDGNDMIVAGMKERHVHPVLWAARITAEGKMQLLDAQSLARFVCKRRS